MPYNESTYKSATKYKKANIKRVPLDMQITYYGQLKDAAMRAGEKVNEYIKKAVVYRMEAEKKNNLQQAPSIGDLPEAAKQESPQ